MNVRPSQGMLCAGGGRWEESPGLKHVCRVSFLTQSIKHSGICRLQPFCAVREVHEYPPILWLTSLFSRGTLEATMTVEVMA